MKDDVRKLHVALMDGDVDVYEPTPGWAIECEVGDSKALRVYEWLPGSVGLMTGAAPRTQRLAIYAPGEWSTAKWVKTK